MSLTFISNILILKKLSSESLICSKYNLLLFLCVQSIMFVSLAIMSIKFMFEIFFLTNIKFLS
jgi:hypothetical protein